MVKLKIRDDIHYLSEKSDDVTSNSPHNSATFYSHIFYDEIPHSSSSDIYSVEDNSPTANGIQPPSEENHIKSPISIRNTIPYIDSGDEQSSGDQIQDIIENEKDTTSHSNTSTSLTLVNCSVTCIPLSAPLVNHQTYCYHQQVPSSVGRCKHQNKKVVSAASSRSIGRFGPYDSPYRGVTRHKWTGKFEAHLWDSSCSAEGRTRKGKQVYLGGYETAEDAARAHDLAALKYCGPSAIAKLNFAISNYENELEEMECMTRGELVTFLRRQSLSFTRGSSIYRGVTRNRKGHWQARIKVASSKKDIYLGTFSSEEKAARAYDIAAIRLKGINALTNFDISDYLQGDSKDLDSIPQPKRVKISGEVSASTSDTETDSQPDGSIPLSDSPLDEIIRRKISASLPDHPTAVLPN